MNGNGRNDVEIVGIVKPRAIGYCRVSTQEQAKKGVSLKNQENKIRSYCELHDYELVEVVIDDGYSATTMKRKGLQRVLGLVKKGQVDAVITLKLDRLFRSTLDALTTTKDWQAKGVRYISINESIDTKSPFGEFFFTLLSAIAQLESRITGERIKESLGHLKQNGKVYGPTPYGYKRKGKRLVEDPIEQKVIGRVMMLESEGKTRNEIAEHLNQVGYRTKKNRAWNWQSVNSIQRRNGGEVV